MRRLPALRRLGALAQLELVQEYPRWIPLLTARGLGLEDAAAVAYNASLVLRAVADDPPPRTVRDVLERYTLDELGALCELYRQVEAGELEYGQKEEET